MLLNKAKTIHTINTAKKPDQKACPGVLPAKKAAENAAIATTHQGKKKPLANDNMSIMRNNILFYFLIFSIK
jgi:hypothetical protein